MAVYLFFQYIKFPDAEKSVEKALGELAALGRELMEQLREVTALTKNATTKAAISSGKHQNELKAKRDGHDVIQKKIDEKVKWIEKEIQKLDHYNPQEFEKQKRKLNDHDKKYKKQTDKWNKAVGSKKPATTQHGGSAVSNQNNQAEWAEGATSTASKKPARHAPPAASTRILRSADKKRKRSQALLDVLYL